MKQIGNKASNQIWNPNESMHPPPTTLGTEERDSELEKYIRRKYEQGAFKAGSAGSKFNAPTSLNRAREGDGRLPSGSVTRLNSVVGSVTSSAWSENKRNPELNDILAGKSNAAGVNTNRDLPALPITHTGAAPRSRPVAGSSNIANPFPTSNVQANSHHNHTAVQGFQNGSQPPTSLVNLDGGRDTTLPLQMNSTTAFGGTNHSNPFNPFQTTQNQLPQQPHSFSGSNFSTSPFNSCPNTAIPQQTAFQGGLSVPSSHVGFSSSVPPPSTGFNHPLSQFDPLSPQPQQSHQHPQSQGYPQNSQGYTPQMYQHQPNQQFNGTMNYPHQQSYMGQVPLSTPPFTSNGYQQYATSWNGANNGMMDSGYIMNGMMR